MSKNFENKFGVYFHIFYACTQSVAKKYYFLWPVQKRQVLMLQKSFLRDIYFSFLHRPHKIFFSRKTFIR
jgi:hypothetical protein